MENAPEIIARKFLNRTNRHLFLTGRAGTGKTTFLREIVSQTHKKAVIAAPTGVAAINAGGVTLHSLFQLPFGTYIPSDGASFENLPFEANTPKTLRKHMQMNATKRRLLQELELLIIDEVSMLRADILDAVDNVLRTVRRMRNVPFGGVQILFIGDLLQLPPVVKDNEWLTLRNYYKSIHFFEALGLQGQPPMYIELEKIYRQSDPVFIDVLNHFRENKVTDADVAILNQHYQPGFKPKPSEGYIYLTTHNRIADKINREELQKLSGQVFRFSADVQKDFREHQYPVDPNLELKDGAQVMFIKNDVSGHQRFFNGKIGTVTELSKDDIEVGFNDGSDPVQVEKHVWQNRRYKLNTTNNEIKEEIMGTFTHYPLKLAWAVTVHKSQGLTFEKAIIDLENAFAPGQIYVALSRMVSMDGLILSSPVPTSGFDQDKDIEAFSASKPRATEVNDILELETHKFVKSKLLQYFDFSDLEDAFGYHLRSYTKDEKRSAKQRYMPRILEIQKGFRPEIEIARKFQNQVLEICNHPNEGYLVLLHARVKAALEFFEPKIKGISQEIIALVEELKDAVGVKAYLKELHDLEGRFFSKLQFLRKSIALIEAVQKKEDLTKQSYSPAGEMEAREVLAEQVKSKKGKVKSGPQRKQGPKGNSKGKKTKGDSAKLSYEMFRSGKSVSEIAKERDLVENTIQSHMVGFIQKGELEILELMDEEKVSDIKAAVKKYYKDSIIPVKKSLGEGYSYAEISMVMALAKGGDEE
jgi:hypothetical protein